jgi:hypothetical protein
MKKSFSIFRTGLVLILLVCITGCTPNAEASPKILQTEASPANPQAQASPTNPQAQTTPTNPQAQATPANPQFVVHFPNISNSGASLDPNAYPAAGTGAPNATSTPKPADPSAATPTKAPTPTLFWPTPRPNVTVTPYIRPSGASGETLPPEKWQDWPVIPVVSDRARQIYRSGLKQGNDPAHFSKVGDCQNIRQYFLGIYDDPTSYRLGSKNTALQGAIDQFSGSWHRLSDAVRSGFNVASVLTPLYANPADCKPGESPLACEIRLWNPSIVIISMETWTPGRPTDTYEGYLRQIVEYALAHNILPIVATKADNLEGDNSINLAVARVAAAYDIPLWNFWRAAQSLPNHGLSSDNFHLTNAPNQFDNPDSMKMGWPVRNLTALQVMDTVWNAVR